MSTRKSARTPVKPSPRLYSVDVSPFEGHTVLGEPLDLLFSCLLRMDFKDQGNGLASCDGYWPEAEAKALVRAMARVEADVAGDERSEGQRSCDRFVAVMFCVLGAVDAVQSTAE